MARDGLEAYDATGAGRAIEAFVDDLSNWYVRRSRRRFWNPAGAGGPRRRRRLPHPVRVPRHGGDAAGAVHAVRRRGAVAEPGRRPRRAAGLGAPVRLPPPPTRPRATPAWTRRWRRPARSSGSDGRVRVETKTRVRQPLAEAVVHYAGDHAAMTPLLDARRRRAQRQAGGVRGVRRGVRWLARQTQLQGARPDAGAEGQGGGDRAGRRRRNARRSARSWRAVTVSLPSGDVDLGTRRRRPGPGRARGLGRGQRRRSHRGARPRISTRTCVAKASRANWCA